MEHVAHTKLATISKSKNLKQAWAVLLALSGKETPTEGATMQWPSLCQRQGKLR